MKQLKGRKEIKCVISQKIFTFCPSGTISAGDSAVHYIERVVERETCLNLNLLFSQFELLLKVLASLGENVCIYISSPVVLIAVYREHNPNLELHRVQS